MERIILAKREDKEGNEFYLRLEHFEIEGENRVLVLIDWRSANTNNCDPAYIAMDNQKAKQLREEVGKLFTLNPEDARRIHLVLPFKEYEEEEFILENIWKEDTPNMRIAAENTKIFEEAAEKLKANIDLDYYVQFVDLWQNLAK